MLNRQPLKLQASAALVLSSSGMAWLVLIFLLQFFNKTSV